MHVRNALLHLDIVVAFLDLIDMPGLYLGKCILPDLFHLWIFISKLLLLNTT